LGSVQRLGLQPCIAALHCSLALQPCIAALATVPNAAAEGLTPLKAAETFHMAVSNRYRNSEKGLCGHRAAAWVAALQPWQR